MVWEEDLRADSMEVTSDLDRSDLVEGGGESLTEVVIAGLWSIGAG